jgi:integrase
LIPMIGLYISGLSTSQLTRISHQEIEPLRDVCQNLLQGDREQDERIISHRNRSQVTRLFKKCVKMVLPEREDITVHSLRYTCCIELFRAGVPIYTVQHWLRHAEV